MGVYIKGMKMPKDDETVKFVKLLNGKMVAVTSPTKCVGDVCEVVEVTEPHGRLIDADKQHKRLQKQVMALYSKKSDKYSYLMDVLYSIHGEPTVIEAEGE